MNIDHAQDIVYSVSDFTAALNQTIEHIYPTVTIRGELANFRISKNKWVYFDLKDEHAIVKFFGTVYMLNSPLEDGMMLRVRGLPRLHPQYGFSLTISSIQPEGEGSIRRAADLLMSKLQAEGLFDDDRKRLLPYPPAKIGLIASRQSAAYADFLKVLGARWRGLTIESFDVQVQGEPAVQQIVGAIDYFNRLSELPDVIVITRGGGSPEDLYAFNTEQITRAVASSRVPTLVAIGHEVDTSLAELAADKRASTPSNAAEILVPDRIETLGLIKSYSHMMYELQMARIRQNKHTLNSYKEQLSSNATRTVQLAKNQLLSSKELLMVLNPAGILRRGYAVVRSSDSRLVRHKSDVRTGDIVNIEVMDGRIDATAI